MVMQADGRGGAAPGAASPVFLCGCPRSGTTLLRVMIDSHPDIAVPPESHFITRMWSVRRRYTRKGSLDAVRLANDIMQGLRFRDWAVEPGEVYRRIAEQPVATYAGTMEAFFRAYAATHGKARWGDKTPEYSLWLPLLSELFPTAKFVHLVRDGRDVALSWLKVKFGPKSLGDAAVMWSYRVRKARRDGQVLGPNRYLEVRYEDLVDDPERTLRRVCDFVELSYEPQMLTYHQRGIEAVPERERRIHVNLSHPVTKRAGWRERMAPADLALFEAIAGPDLEAFGYPRNGRHIGPMVAARAAAIRLSNVVRRLAWLGRRWAVIQIRRPPVPPPRLW